MIKKAKGKDGFYVYGEDKKRHSKEPMTLEMAKKQMTAMNIAHARKAAPKAVKIVKAVKAPKEKVPASVGNPKKSAVGVSKKIEKIVETANVRSGYGLANDARWVSAVKSGGRVAEEAKPAKTDVPAPINLVS